MNELCIPLYATSDCVGAEVEVRMADTGKTLHYRLECFKLQTGEQSKDSTEKVNQLRKFIQSYSADWELLQIMDTPKGCDYVQLLYRENS